MLHLSLRKSADPLLFRVLDRPRNGVPDEIVREDDVFSLQFTPDGVEQGDRPHAQAAAATPVNPEVPQGEDVHRVSPDVDEGDGGVILEGVVMPAQGGMALGEYPAIRNAAAVGRILEAEADLPPQEVIPESLLLSAVDVDGQTYAKSDLCFRQALRFHRVGDGGEREDEGIRLFCLVLLEAHPPAADGVVRAVVQELHLRRDKFPVAHGKPGGIQEMLRGFGVVVPVVDSNHDLLHAISSFIVLN